MRVCVCIEKSKAVEKSEEPWSSKVWKVRWSPCSVATMRYLVLFVFGRVWEGFVVMLVFVRLSVVWVLSVSRSTLLAVALFCSLLRGSVQ